MRIEDNMCQVALICLASSAGLIHGCDLISIGYSCLSNVICFQLSMHTAASDFCTPLELSCDCIATAVQWQAKSTTNHQVVLFDWHDNYGMRD